MGIRVNLLRQALLVGVAGVAALVVVIVTTFVGEALGVTQISGWFAHGNFILPWGFLAILIYIPIALADDRRRGSSNG